MRSRGPGVRDLENPASPVGFFQRFARMIALRRGVMQPDKQIEPLIKQSVFANAVEECASPDPRRLRERRAALTHQMPLDSSVRGNERHQSCSGKLDCAGEASPIFRPPSVVLHEQYQTQLAVAKSERWMRRIRPLRAKASVR